jgi:Amt family ammonium transporter
MDCLRLVGQEPSDVYATTVPHLAFMMYQGMFAIFTVALFTGAIVGACEVQRAYGFLRFMAYFVYSPVAHWVWGSGGWLAGLGALDFAGGTVVHI